MKRFAAILLAALICFSCGCKSKTTGGLTSDTQSVADVQKTESNIKTQKKSSKSSKTKKASQAESFDEESKDSNEQSTADTEDNFEYNLSYEFEDMAELECEKIVKLYNYDASPYSMPNFEKLWYTDEKSGQTLAYVLYVPKSMPAGGCPVYLFLHGAGECGNTYNHYYERIRKAFSVAGDFLSNSIVLAPQCPTGKWWSIDEYYGGDEKGCLSAAKRLLDEVIEKYGANRNRIYVTGLSMGGYATWDLLAKYGNFFAAAAPICGGGDAYAANTLKNIPIMIYHGTADQTVSYNSSLNMFNAINNVGGSMCRMISLLNVGHGAWDYSYIDRELFCWMFAQELHVNQSLNYSTKLSFAVTDPEGKVVITDPDVEGLRSRIKDSKEYLGFELTPLAATKLENSYKKYMGKTYTLYFLGQKLYDFKPQKIHNDMVFYTEKTIKEDYRYYAITNVFQNLVLLNLRKREVSR